MNFNGQPFTPQKHKATYPLQYGYAFQSSRRHPKAPDTVVVGVNESKAAKFVGFARIDGQEMRAFKVTGARRYYFQSI